MARLVFASPVTCLLVGMVAAVVTAPWLRRARWICRLAIGLTVTINLVI